MLENPSVRLHYLFSITIVSVRLREAFSVFIFEVSRRISEAKGHPIMTKNSLANRIEGRISNTPLMIVHSLLSWSSENSIGLTKQIQLTP